MLVGEYLATTSPVVVHTPCGVDLIATEDTKTRIPLNLIMNMVLWRLRVVLM